MNNVKLLKKRRNQERKKFDFSRFTTVTVIFIRLVNMISG